MALLGVTSGAVGTPVGLKADQTMLPRLVPSQAQRQSSVTSVPFSQKSWTFLQ